MHKRLLLSSLVVGSIQAACAFQLPPHQAAPSSPSPAATAPGRRHPTAQHQQRVAPLHSSLGSMFGRMIAGALKGPAPAPDMSGFQDGAPSWAELGALLESQQTEAERQLPELRAKGRGPYSPKADLRLFDAPDGYEPRVTLYRDSAAWCPYCMKTLLFLEEKRIPYKVQKVPMRCYGQKPAWFSRLSATGLLPVAEIDGDIVTESDVILQALEDRFPDAVPLLPLARDPAAQALPGLLRLERELFSGWLRWLTGSTLTNERQKLNFESLLGRVEEALGASGGPYFLGSFFSVVDCVFAPFVERMAGSLYFYKGFKMRDPVRFPHLCRWFDAMETRDSYRGIRSDWYTHAMDLPPQVGGCTMIPEAEPFANEIAGRDGSWTLPLKAAGSGIEPLLPGVDEAAARREAAAQLVGNHAAVARFAARALGEPGVPPVTAELADPNAKPNEAYVPLLDAALRVVAQALLSGPEAAKPAVSGLVANEAVAAALDYLRGRVGVPRDMSFEAARQFRGHLGWLIDQLAAVA